MEGDIKVTPANRKCSAVTGSTRKIKDNAADWHNLMVRWEKLNEDGFNVAGNMVDIRLRHSQSDLLTAVDESSSPSPSSPLLQQTGGASELQDECCKLQDVVDKMVVVVKKMERLSASQRGVQNLEEFQFGLEGRKYPLFHSWNAKHFSEGVCCLMSFFMFQDSFSQELKLKQTILQELAHTSTSDLCMVYLSCWLHQPFITSQTRLTLEALLLETGHHPL
ncbi:cyclin-dependent kinase 2-interacting protein [Anoplopoma fimbria]|uniref:cyclin-dependent kinase 2-interacting protein n=1 Tax=Anoplopoma fimbria TaxID=229290 RepID=UPI0023EBF901|nr:cyclin-dependent kinase 2-interacting protein [Anoplopoma fimbria]